MQNAYITASCFVYHRRAVKELYEPQVCILPCRDWPSPWKLSTANSHKLLTSAWKVVFLHWIRNSSLCVPFLTEKAIADFVLCFNLQTKPLTYKTVHSLLKPWAAAWFWHSAMYLLQWILFTLCTTAAPRSPGWWQSTHYIKKSHYFPKSSTYIGTTKERKMQFLPFKDEDQMKHQTGTRNKLTYSFLPSLYHPKTFFVSQKHVCITGVKNWKQFWIFNSHLFVT